MSIAENVARIRAEMEKAALACGRDPKSIQLCAATKMNDADAVRQAIAAGVDCCGENKVQELTQKLAENAYEGAPVHFIGHLQTNKVKYIAPFVSLIESLDSERLAEEINRQAEKCGRRIDCLLEIHVTAEESKSGWDYAELLAFVRSGGFAAMPHIRLRGVMGMATFTDDEATVRGDFKRLNECFTELKEYFGAEFDTLSMGMSDSYRVAIEEGSTLVRVGRKLFNKR